MIDEKLLEELRGREVVLLVADKDEISASEVPFPVVYTGMGKMRMYDALVRWYAVRTERDPVILNIGSAGSARYPIGELLSCSCFVNGGSELIYDRINLPGKEGCSMRFKMTAPTATCPVYGSPLASAEISLAKS